MIPRIVHSSWRRQEQFAFGRGKSARGLRILVDSETIPDSPYLEVLLAFAHHPEVELIGTDDRFANRLHVRAYDARNAYTPCEFEFDDGRKSLSGVRGPDTQRIGHEFAEPGQEERGEQAAVMVTAAADHDVDAFATADPLLLEKLPRHVVEDGNPMTIDETVALLGLFLRVREDFTLDLGPGYRHTTGRSGFYFVLMRDLTPSGWRWFSGCVAHSHHTGADRLMLTAQSALERIERSLRARDRLHERLQLPASRDLSIEAMFYFDVALLMLGAAFDGLANVAHVVHGLTGSERQIGWGIRSWMKKLRAENPSLAQMMAPGQRHRDARDLVAILRNTIHQESLQTITWFSGGRRSEHIVLPPGIEAELEEVIARVGNADEYGVRREQGGRLYIDPGHYIERILPIVFASINAVMDATPVDTMSGVDPANLPAGPPDDEDGMFGAANRRRIRLLGGIQAR